MDVLRVLAPRSPGCLAALPRAAGRRAAKRPREAYRAQKGGPLPRGIFVHIAGYSRSSRGSTARALALRLARA